jgi:hypothetical protein
MNHKGSPSRTHSHLKGTRKRDHHPYPNALLQRRTDDINNQHGKRVEIIASSHAHTMASTLTTSITLTKAEGGEKLVSTFDFSPETKLTAQSLFAYGRRFVFPQQENIFLPSPR